MSQFFVTFGPLKTLDNPPLWVYSVRVKGHHNTEGHHPMDLIIIRNATDKSDAILRAMRQSRYVKLARCRWINATDVAVTLVK
jgi:hypothetical protein